MIYTSDGKKLWYPNIVGDEISDDTVALQNAINSNMEIHLDSSIIRLTAPININPYTIKIFDGGNSIFIVDGDFSAFVITGTATGTADPSTQTVNVLEKESGFIFENAVIIGKNKWDSQSFNDSVGITVNQCFGLTIQNCYITQVKDGIVVSGTNRNLTFANNQIYNLTGCGLRYLSSVNLHQHNVVGNMVQYCKYCFRIEGSKQIANFQLSGNDFEISTYPNSDLTSQRCILIESGDTEQVQMSEIVIAGNTIQGHSLSNCIIEIVGGAIRPVRFVSIVGNHISNTLQTLINMTKTINATISGNTFFSDNSLQSSYAIDVNNSKAIAISGNTLTSMGYLVKTHGSSKSVSVTGNSLSSYANKVLDNIDTETTIIEYGNTNDVVI